MNKLFRILGLTLAVSALLVFSLASVAFAAGPNGTQTRQKIQDGNCGISDNCTPTPNNYDYNYNYSSPGPHGARNGASK